MEEVTMPTTPNNPSPLDIPPRVFTLQGRLGRLRYMAYSWLSFLACVLALTMTKILPETQGLIAGAACYLAATVFSLIVTKRRFNDLNQSSWLSVLALIPVVNLFAAFILTFFRGTNGENRFGLRPAKNTVGVKVLGSLVPVMFFVGILAAIVVPQYQQYLERYKALNGQPGTPSIAVALVKNGVFEINKTLTIGDSFDRWGGCTNKEWTDFKTNNGVQVVNFTCDVIWPEKLKKSEEYAIGSNGDAETPHLAVSSISHLYQFTLNTDDTFQLENIFEEVKWDDGAVLEHSPDTSTQLNVVYANEGPFILEEQQFSALASTSIWYAMMDLYAQGSINATLDDIE